MAVGPKQQIETLREKIKNGDRGGSERDRELLIEFSDKVKLRSSEYSDHRHLKLMRHLNMIAEEVEFSGDGILEGCLRDKEAAEEVVRWIHDNYDNEETNRDYRVSMRVFGRFMADQYDIDTDDDGIPVTLTWISATTSNSYNPTPNPAELWDWDEVDQLIEVAKNPRDAAMVALMMDAGPRGGEFVNIEKGDITDADHGLQLWLDGKTGERSVTLIPSTPYVTRWLSDHPGADSDPLWTKLNEAEPISRQRMYQLLERLAERAGFDPDKKPTTPTNFRKSNASHLAKTGANAALIEDRQGRSRGSDAVSRYVATFGEESEQAAYAKLHGRDVDQDTAERRDIQICPRCDWENPPEKPYCANCYQSLDPEAAAEARKTDNVIQRVRSSIEDALYAKLAEIDDIDQYDWDREEAEEQISALASQEVRGMLDNSNSWMFRFEDEDIDDLITRAKKARELSVEDL